VIYAREVVPAALFDAVYGPNGGDTTPPPDEAVLSLLTAMRTSSALDRCHADAQALVEEARRELAGLPAGPARDALYDLAGYVVARHG
jgi:heptaprenyl diphosphate synthase